MSLIFQSLEGCAWYLLETLKKNGTEVVEDHGFSWANHFFASSKFRRAHLDIVDARDTKKLYMMHLCVFPHVTDDSPIYGFDIIAGPNKVTGAFHDFSPNSNRDHPMYHWFRDRVRDLEWSKKRALPEWATNIFSDSMVAAGNINTIDELNTVLYLAKSDLRYYLEHVGGSSDRDTTASQDYYCENQRKNPHTPRVMQSLGIEPDDVQRFISECLFPPVSLQV
jgi:Ferredoxin-dependent bilin reductase